ncbi:hypothetical protein NE236_12245 [Actinoallomurus purpureus]|uniref:hypothetical protein n=1 Tax=Actinoallomurus purpureus TaxID=478114 RepID=UPI002092E462|nr:hypothetical protein [Actinoallomurus purpureus]MCO6005754.1 hypothetical protein [Actinoallomurus purpureus]
MNSSIPERRNRAASPRQHMVRSHSLRALAVAARLERHHAPEGPPGRSRVDDADGLELIPCSAPDC